MDTRQTLVNPSKLILRASQQEEQWPSVVDGVAASTAWAFQHHLVVESFPMVLSLEHDGKDHLAVLALEQECHASTCTEERVDGWLFSRLNHGCLKE
jgi:hypothetical protein